MWDIKKERILEKMKFTTPIEMPRGTHYGSNYFIVYSHKIKRNVKLYSNLEYYNFLTLETDPNVEYFCEQPHEISVCSDNKLGKAIFDMFVEYKDGKIEFQEVKYKGELTGENDSSRRSQEQIRRQQHWCEENNINFAVRTEDDIIKGRFHMQNLNVIAARIRRYVPTENIYYDNIIKKMLKKNSFTIKSLIDHQMLPLNHEFDHICYLYCKGDIQMDVENQPLDNRMEVKL